MFSRQYARVLQGFFRVDGVFRAPALSPLTSRAAPTGIGIVQRALRPELLPGMMPPVRLDGSHRSGSTASVQRAITRPGGPLARLRAYPSRPAPGPLLRAAAPRAPADDVHATWVETARLFTSGTGQPLASAICRSMEAMFDTDFSAVRVHHGPAARALGALAFTSGDDIYFAPGQYAPHSRHGLELLGHELAHVVQQRAGHVVNPFGHGIAVVQDPRLEHEADAMARLIGTRMWHWRSASGSQASAGERAERARRPGRGRGQGAAQLMEDRGSDRRSIDIELTPPPKDKDKDKITITMQLTEEILKEAGDPRKTELFKRRLAKALAQASPDCLPAVTKLAGLARDVRVLIQKNDNEKRTVTMRLAILTTTTLDKEGSDSIYKSDLPVSELVEALVEKKIEEQYARMREEARPEKQPKLAEIEPRVLSIGTSGKGEAMLAIYSREGDRRALILYAHGYEHQKYEADTKPDRAYVFLVRAPVTLSRPSHGIQALHLALPQLAGALEDSEVRGKFMSSASKMGAFRVAYHRPDELTEDLAGLSKAMAHFDVGVLVFSRPCPEDKLEANSPFETSVPLPLVLNSPELDKYENVVLHICRSPIVITQTGALNFVRDGLPQSFHNVFYSVDNKEYRVGE